MATNEDLYRELEDAERRDDARFKQQYAMKAVKVARKESDPDKAKARFEKELAPIFEARRRIAMGLPPTNNILLNLWLKIRGEDKLEELPESEIVNPSKGLVMSGPTIEEVQKMIAAEPEKFKDLRRTGPKVQHVDAQRKTTDDLIDEAQNRHA